MSLFLQRWFSGNKGIDDRFLLRAGVHPCQDRKGRDRKMPSTGPDKLDEAASEYMKQSMRKSIDGGEETWRGIIDDWAKHLGDEQGVINFLDDLLLIFDPSPKNSIFIDTERGNFVDLNGEIGPVQLSIEIELTGSYQVYTMGNIKISLDKHTGVPVSKWKAVLSKILNRLVPVALKYNAKKIYVIRPRGQEHILYPLYGFTTDQSTLAMNIRDLLEFCLHGKTNIDINSINHTRQILDVKMELTKEYLEKMRLEFFDIASSKGTLPLMYNYFLAQIQYLSLFALYMIVQEGHGEDYMRDYMVHGYGSSPNFPIGKWFLMRGATIDGYVPYKPENARHTEDLFSASGKPEQLYLDLNDSYSMGLLKQKVPGI